MRDILPEDQKYWQFAQNLFDETSSSLGFSRLIIPSVEELSLFERGIGEATDIVEKEMFVIAAKSDDNATLALRPELTAGCVRAYIENGMKSKPQPVRLSLFGSAFRRERPQKNRYREFYQLDFEAIGDEKALWDVYIIYSSLKYLERLGLKNIRTTVNSIGCRECRPSYREKLIKYFKDNVDKLCEDCKRRLRTNPLRILDCKEPACQGLSKDAPKMLDNLCPACDEHFDYVKSSLNNLNVDFEINPQLVRGLDYYNRTVFEFNQKADTGRQSSLGGGGRYDYLFEMIGESPTPAVGVALGLDRIVNALKENSIEIPKVETKQILIVGTPDTVKQCLGASNKIFETTALTPLYFPQETAIGKQLELANKLQVDYAVIIGPDELKSGKYQLKDLKTGEQKQIKPDKLVELLS